MKGKPGPAAAVLRPILDTYMDAAVAIVGCNSRGIERYSCEYDILVVGDERQPASSLRLGDVFVDLVFLSERDVLKPSNPEHVISLSYAKPVRDASLVLSTSTAASSAVLAESAAKASETRLASSLKTLGRAEAALSRKDVLDADFWLLAASYEFAYALLLSREVQPSPSHLLSQLRASSGGNPHGFEGVSIGTGLEAASRAGCGARLEGVSVIHDLLREGSKAGEAGQTWSKTRTEILAAKAQELVTRVELAECYSFLGQELVDDMMHLLGQHPKRTLTSLSSDRDGLLGERVLRQLGLARSKEAVGSGLGIVKELVSQLARSA